MDYVTPTIFSAQYLATTLLGKQYTPITGSTLNDKWNIANSVTPIASERPVMKYLAIGNGGHTVSSTNGSAPYVINPITHKPNHVALYNHIPWVIRPATNDLSATDRDKYRMRVQITAGGTDYIAYYLKVLDTSASMPAIQKVIWNNAGKNTSVFAASDAILNPTPTTLTGSQQTSTDEYVSVDTSITILFDSATVSEIQNATNIIYGVSDYDIISEVGLYQGIDVQYTNTIAGIPATYTESVYTQPTIFANMFMALQFANLPATFTIDIGALEPMKL